MKELVNILAVIVSAIASFIIGGIYYHPKVLGTKWMHLIGKSRDQMHSPKKAMTMVIAPSIVLPIAIGVLFNHVDVSSQNNIIGVALLLTVIVMSLTANEMIFENRPKKLWLLNGGYQLIDILVISYIMALWR